MPLLASQAGPTSPSQANSPAPPPAVAQAPVTDLAGQLREAQFQLSGLQAEWRGLRAQLDAMLQNNPARPRVQQQWADVGIHIAQVQGNIAVLQARLGQRQGTSTTTPAPSGGRIPVDPGVVIPAATVLLLACVIPLSIGFARRIARGGRTASSSLPSDQASRLERIEHALDTIAIEVERVSEGQRFMAKVLIERPDRAGAESNPASAAEPLALGAGPLEPLRVPEGERVKQGIPNQR